MDKTLIQKLIHYTEQYLEDLENRSYTSISEEDLIEEMKKSLRQAKKEVK